METHKHKNQEKLSTKSNKIKSSGVGMTLDSSSGLEVQVLSMSWFFSLDFFLYFKQLLTLICILRSLITCKLEIRKNLVNNQNLIEKSSSLY